MSSNIELSKGCLKNMFSNKTGPATAPITVQVTNIRPVILNGELKKFRILITDGVYLGHGLVDEECVPYVNNNAIDKTSIIKIKDFNTFSTQKHIILIKNLEVVQARGEKVNSKDFINVDTYFAEHPDEDSLLLSKKNDLPTPSPAAGSLGTAPILMQQDKPSAAGQSVQPPQKQPGRISPIESLSPYQNNWIIKARVSYKGDLRTWSNARGEGKLFNVNLLDESDEIRATAFNEIAEKYHKMLEEGKVYYFSKARIQAAKKQFNSLLHPYELLLERDSEVTECFDTADVPKLNFNFVKLNEIVNLEQNQIIDVIGALKTVSEAYQITAKSTGKAFDRRNITIVDETGVAIDVGLWNGTATDFNIPEGSVVAFKACKIQDFNGRSLTLTHTGSMIANPETPELYQLKGWYDNEGIKENFKTLKQEGGAGGSSIGNRKLILEAQEENLGKNDKPDYFNIKATISFTKHETFCYPACAQQVQNQYGLQLGRPAMASACNRKVIEGTDGKWRCERCDSSTDEPTWRYIFNCAVMDTSGQIWITLFDGEATKLFGCGAGELLEMQQANKDDPSDTRFTDKIASVTFREFGFRIKARQDTYNDSIRIRYQAAGIEHLDFNLEAEYLCQELLGLLN